MSLPEEELIDYIKHIKKTLSEDNGNKILAKVTKKANDEGIDTVEHLLTADALRDMKFIINQAHADLVVIHALGSDDKRFVSFEENLYFYTRKENNIWSLKAILP